jgi:hypothetical protein
VECVQSSRPSTKNRAANVRRGNLSESLLVPESGIIPKIFRAASGGVEHLGAQSSHGGIELSVGEVSSRRDLGPDSLNQPGANWRRFVVPNVVLGGRREFHCVGLVERLLGQTGSLTGRGFTSRCRPPRSVNRVCHTVSHGFLNLATPLPYTGRGARCSASFVAEATNLRNYAAVNRAMGSTYRH